MKLVLIGAASAAALALAAPAAAQYPPPPPPPSDADQYGPPHPGDQDPSAYGAPQDQAGQDAQDQADEDSQDMAAPDDQSGPPDDQDDDQAYGAQAPDMSQDQPGYPPPQGGQGYPPPPPSGQGYVPPAQDHYGPAEGGYAGPPPPPPAPSSRYAPGPANPSQRFEGGPAYEPGGDLVDREDRLEQRIHHMADRGRLDPRSAHALLAELRSIRDEQDQMMQSGRGLDPTDEQRLSQRLDALQQRLRSMRMGGY